MDEIDFLMRVTSGGVTTYEDADALIAQLDEWLNTPRGSIYGRPDWGNLFIRYKHQPTDDSTAVIIENEILPVLKRDLPALRIGGLRCDPDGVQDYTINFMTNAGLITRRISAK